MSTLSILVMPVRSEAGVASLCRRAAFLAEAVGFGRPVQTRYITAVSEVARWLAGQGGDGFTAHMVIETRGNTQYLAVRMSSRSGLRDKVLATTPIAAVRRLVEIMEWDDGGGSARLHLAQSLPPGSRSIGPDDVAGWLDALEEKTEDTLRETSERLRLALETSHTGTWTWEIGDDTMIFDDQAHRILGLKPHSFVGGQRDFAALVHPEDIARLDRQLQRAAAEGAKFRSEFRVRWPNGDERRIVARGMPVRDRGGVVRSLTGVCYDATDYFQDEERTRRRQKIEAIGEMAGSMAHEINNLLQPIVSMAEMVCDDLAEDDLLRHDVAVILASARQAAAIIRNVLVFARQTEPVRDPTPCAQAVEEGLRLVRPFLPPTVSVVTDVTPDAGLVALGTTDMQQILLNLITNATKAMASNGTIRVTLGRRILDEPDAQRLDTTPGPCFALTVADTGCGMDAATQALVFEPFFTTRPAGEGTGLGLSVVFGIVRGAGGAIHVDSDVGAGTEFVIHLPEYR